MFKYSNLKYSRKNIYFYRFALVNINFFNNF